MSNYKGVLVYLAAFLSAALSASEITCRGGDGPISFINISQKFPTETDEITTYGEVQDFIHWPDKKKIVYRNDSGQLRKVSYKSQVTEDKFISNLNSGLSSLVDPNERFVLTSRYSWYLDAEETNPSWGQFQASSAVVHLFWHHVFLGPTYLYSITNEAPSCKTAPQEISILKYTTGSVKPEKCLLDIGPDEYFYLGSGHTHPYVFLYKIYETAAGSYLSLYRIKIDSFFSSCKLEKLKSYPNPIPGEIQSVHQFEKEDTFAVVTHLASTKKLFWDSPKTPGALCNFGRREPIILGENEPIVAGWEPESGLSLIFPDDKSYAEILPEKTKGEVRRKDMRLSENGKTLFLNLKNLNGIRELSAFSMK